MASKQQKYGLPLDIWILILSRLPVKSLVRSRFVCKAWHDVIDSAFFVNTHLNYQKSPANINKHLLHVQSPYSTLCTDCEAIFDETNKDSKLYYTPKSFGRDYTGEGRRGICGICDGLLCVSDLWHRVGNDIHLWNPICRKAKKLPKLEISIEKKVGFDKNGAVSFGFYDDDYKVTVISPVGDTSCIVSVYSLSGNCWKTFPRFNFEQKFGGFWPVHPTRFIDGTTYIYVLTRAGRIVVWFDLRDEISRQLKLPEKLYQGGRTCILEAYGEKLAIFGCGRTDIGMWILKDKSSSISPWENKFVIKLEQVGLTLPVGFLHNGKYLVRTYNAEKDVTMFYLCDPESPNLIKFRSLVGADHGYYFSKIVSNCVESLLLLNEDSLDPMVDSKMGFSNNTSMLFRLYNYISSPSEA